MNKYIIFHGVLSVHAGCVMCPDNSVQVHTKKKKHFSCFNIPSQMNRKKSSFTYFVPKILPQVKFLIYLHDFSIFLIS